MGSMAEVLLCGKKIEILTQPQCDDNTNSVTSSKGHPLFWGMFEVKESAAIEWKQMKNIVPATLNNVVGKWNKLSRKVS